MKVAAHYRHGLSYLEFHTEEFSMPGMNQLRTAGALPLLSIFSWDRHSGSEIPRLALTQADSKELQVCENLQDFLFREPASKSFHPVPMGTCIFQVLNKPSQSFLLCTPFIIVWLATCQEVEAQKERHEILGLGRTPIWVGTPTQSGSS